MTTHAEARSTRVTFAITVVVFAALILGGLIVGTVVWPKAHAATAVTSFEITPLMSNVDAAKLPVSENRGPVLKDCRVTFTRLPRG